MPRSLRSGREAQPTVRDTGSTRFAHVALKTGLVYLFVPLTAFLTGPVLARVLGPDDRGLLAGVLAPIALASLFMSFGLPEATTYFTARFPASRRRLAIVGCGAGLAVGLVAVAVLHAYAAVAISDPFGQDLVRDLSWLLPPLLGLAALRAALMGSGRFSVVNVERSVGALARLGAVVALAVTGTLTVASAAWATEATFLAVALIIILPAAVRLFGDSTDRGPEVGEVLAYGLRVWPGVMAGVVLLRADQAIMLPLAGAEQLGLYAVAVAIAEVLNLGVVALRDVLMPTVSRAWNVDVLARATRCFIILMVPVVIAAIAVVPVGLPLLYGKDFAPAVPMAQVLCLSALPFGLSLLMGAGLMAAGRPGLTSVVQGVSAVVAVTCLVLLLPVLGGMGAALVSLIAYSVGAVMSSFIFRATLGASLGALVVPRREDVAFLIGLVRRN